MSGVSDVTSNAAPLGSTGAPGENTCAKSTCHTGAGVNSGTALLNLNFSNNAATYKPDSLYELSVSLQQAGINRFGFQMLALNANNESCGTFVITDSTRTQTQKGNGTYEGRDYVTYTYKGTEPFTAGLGKWAFNWQAPAAYQGPVTFYATAVAADNDGTDAGDTVYATQHTVQQNATGILSEKPANFKLNLFPNPASSLLQVQYKTLKPGETQIVLRDLAAQTVYATVSRVDNAGEQNVTIPVSQLNSGIYMLAITLNGQTQTQKVVIQK